MALLENNFATLNLVREVSKRCYAQGMYTPRLVHKTCNSFDINAAAQYSCANLYSKGLATRYRRQSSLEVVFVRIQKTIATRCYFYFYSRLNFRKVPVGYRYLHWDRTEQYISNEMHIRTAPRRISDDLSLGLKPKFFPFISC